ncbi:hypothetical protein SmJEL517_g01158 [Synchytrium microbalum]|uniref:WD repeat-containing protein JIP5 n=1 Tax=Synchytrium microbalum TaxID=1806994 RepID=A0A507CB87_9FUNG|nr:uncharacterized protein SmJEL517_g01158 [Synchytrium microbalum]TPX36618.1 hypothetical protein SmJEL517_g01158 [Synchytrium microbalum]
MAITFNTNVFGLSLHPSKEILAAGLLDGSISLYNYEADPKPIFTLKPHKSAVRSVDFHPSGEWLCSVSADHSIQHVNVETKKIVVKIPSAHESAINALTFISPTLYTTGDEDGRIKLWDTRTPTIPTHTYNIHTDYISQLYYDNHKKMLLATGGDGMLSVYDPRNTKKEYITDSQDDEFLCLCIHKNHSKVLVGTSSGIVNVFDVGKWDEPVERIPGHPSSVTGILEIDDSTVLTSGSDGLVRVMQTYPHKVLGIVELPEGQQDSAECMRLSVDNRWLVVAQEERVCVVDVAYLFEEGDDDEEEGVQEEVDGGSVVKGGSAQEGEDDEDTGTDGSDSDSESSNEDEEVVDDEAHETTNTNNKRTAESSDSSDASEAEEKADAKPGKPTRRQKRRALMGDKRPKNEFFAGID